MASGNKEYDSLKLNNQVCFPLYACSKELIRQYGPYLRQLDLTYTQYLVMMVLWEREKVTSRELSECLYLDYGTLTPVLKRLQSAGYIIKERSAEDERILNVSLTDEGRKLKDQAINIPEAMGSVMGLDAEEFATLYRLTYKALKNMEQKN
ncbi:MAG: MarR family transcriptional regulator [Erysipelotrichaceae bacterium]|nr:MarR family transcriptional regulator [Erysipelotrichaceae bacterium]